MRDDHHPRDANDSATRPQSTSKPSHRLALPATSSGCGITVGCFPPTSRLHVAVMIGGMDFDCTHQMRLYV